MIMTEVGLEKHLEDNQVWHRFIDKQETVHTADAARAAGVDLHRLTKNLVSKTDQEEVVLLVVPGDRKVDLKSAAQALSARRVHLVSFAEAERISGYPPGATPSIGHKTAMRTVIDKSLLEHETIYCGGGTRERLVELKTKDVIRVSNAVIADISKMQP